MGMAKHFPLAQNGLQMEVFCAFWPKKSGPPPMKKYRKNFMFFYLIKC